MKYGLGATLFMDSWVSKIYTERVSVVIDFTADGQQDLENPIKQFFQRFLGAQADVRSGD